ncbi:hypothetical protein ASC87_25890 [Rhizobacter sp. Root1221]|nr:hypothetical protein ASC87_25890 [Rhizobacter sp. Root1221]
MRLRSTDPEYRQSFQSEVVEAVRTQQAQGLGLQDPGRKATAQSAAELTGEIVVVDTLRGVLAANFPDWLKQEILEDAGYTAGFDQLTDAQLDAKLPKLSIDMDALPSVSEQFVPSTNATILSVDGRVQAAGSSYPRIAGMQALGLCSKKRENKMYEKSFSLNKSMFSPVETKTGDLTTTFQTVVRGDGTVTGAVHYVMKKRCGIPYGAEYDHVEFKLVSTLGGEIAFDAKTRYEHKERLFKKNFTYDIGSYDFWVYFLEFRLQADLQFDVGVDLAMLAEAEVRAGYTLGGKANITWVCRTTSDCVKTRSEVDLKPVLKETNSYQAKAALSVIPFIDSSVGANLSLYYGLLDLVGVRVGVLTEVPVTGFAYIGNMCSDADGDGTSEQVKGAYLDVSVQFSGYFKWELLGKGATADITLDLEPIGYRKEWRQVDLNGESRMKNFYVKNLYFKDLLSEGSSLFQPVLKTPKVIKQGGTLQLATRSCYPLTGEPIYEVDFGAGGPLVRGKASELAYAYPRFGDYTVRVRLVADSQGRTFDTSWSTFRVNVSPDGKTPYYPWLATLLDQLLD